MARRPRVRRGGDADDDSADGPGSSSTPTTTTSRVARMPTSSALLMAACAAVLLAAQPAPAGAAQCPPLKFKTVDVECRWVMSRPVPCDVPATPGTRALFSCKPLYRLPSSVLNEITRGYAPPPARPWKRRQPGDGDDDEHHRLKQQQQHHKGGGNSMDSAVCREDGTWAPLPFTCVPECGRLKGKGETLIVDGKPVHSPIEYPWHVAVYDKKHNGGNGITQVCGGTLITPKFFVSAAHCFVDPQTLSSQSVRMRAPSDYAAAVGKLNRKWDIHEDTAQTRDVLQIHVNGYGGQRLNHVKDLALVEMASDVDLTASTLPACVDWGMEEKGLKEGDVGAVVGWGDLQYLDPSDTLTSASLPYVPREKCLRIVPPNLVQYVLLAGDRFCAGEINGTTVAHGDSGGGLCFQNADRRWFLHGVVSVGMPKQRTLAAFTNVTSFARWMADKIQDEEIRAAAAAHHVPVEIPTEYTASGLEEEQHVAYFREDLGLSLHHVHWHNYYTYFGTREEVDKDRRGELLFYMHHQMQARYNMERLANKMPRAKRLDLREPIAEGYYPKLDNLVSSRVWPGRPPHTRLQNVHRDGIDVDLEDIERWTARIYEAIAMGKVVKASGGEMNLTADLLGNIVQPSTLSPNRQLYGELLNMGQIMVALAHDPENRFLESFSVTGDAATSLRDPVFYRWNAYTQEMMRAHKDSLPSYTDKELSFPGVSVRSVAVHAETSDRPNELLTHWQVSDLELSRGLDFSPRQPVFVRTTHLQHKPFTYHIQVENKGVSMKEGYVRIFILPKYDVRGKAMKFSEQQHYAVELDKFVVELQPGINMIERKSAQSSLTIPFERTFRNLDMNRPAQNAHSRSLDEFTFCGCGLPQHLLLPRGTESGMPLYLLVMVSDYARDKVEQDVQGSCNDAHILCGVFGGRYPDRRPMGFPLDRKLARGGDSLRALLTPNMFVLGVDVRLRDAVLTSHHNATVFGNRGAGASSLPHRQRPLPVITEA